jgi:hypothetical protein
MAEYILVHGIRVAKDFTPETFGRLTTLGPIFRVGEFPYQVCECTCGAYFVANVFRLRAQTTQSCGCLRKELVYKHGKSRIGGKIDTTYSAWKAMRKRCSNPNTPRYKHYGGRGIKVCQRWQTFENFFADMGQRPSPKHSLDRIDVNGDYSPENCRWATVEQQANNKQNTMLIVAFGKSMAPTEWSSVYGIPSGTIIDRIRKGWEPEAAVKDAPYSKFPRGHH